MNKTVKKVLISLLVIPLALFLLFTEYLIYTFHGRGELMESYRSYAPFNCPDSRWVCQEEDLYFIMDESRCGTGTGTLDGEAVFFQIFPDNFVPGVVVDSLHINYSGGHYATTLLTGNGYFEEDKFTLKYNAEQYPDSWGGDEGTVTLTFLRDKAYRPFDFARDAANSKWVCTDRDIWFSSDADGVLSGESGVNGEAVPFRLRFDRQPECFRAEKILAEGEGSKYPHYDIMGSAWCEEDCRILQYSAKADPHSFWGQAQDNVTLHFFPEEPDALSGEAEGSVRWRCAERDIFFFQPENESCRGESREDGAAYSFNLFFCNNAECFLAEFLPPDEDGEAAVSSLIIGGVWYDGERCVLQYYSTQDGDALWGREPEGTVTLTFLREDLPKPADFSGNG